MVYRDHGIYGQGMQGITGSRKNDSTFLDILHKAAKVVNTLFRWFPSSSLETYFRSSSFVEITGSWSFLTKFPSWSLGTSGVRKCKPRNEGCPFLRKP